MRGRSQRTGARRGVRNGSFNCVQRNALTNRNTSWDNNAVGLHESNAYEHTRIYKEKKKHEEAQHTKNARGGGKAKNQ